MAVALLLTVEFLQLVGVQPQLWQALRTTFAANVVQPIKDGVSRAWHGEVEDDRPQPQH
jgi:hypothetical protein